MTQNNNKSNDDKNSRAQSRENSNENGRINTESNNNDRKGIVNSNVTDPKKSIPIDKNKKLPPTISNKGKVSNVKKK